MERTRVGVVSLAGPVADRQPLLSPRLHVPLSPLFLSFSPPSFQPFYIHPVSQTTQITMSDNFSDNGHSPEDALLDGHPTKKHAGRCKWQGWLKIGLGVWATVATVGMFPR